jgi:hypothetical protein
VRMARVGHGVGVGAQGGGVTLTGIRYWCSLGASCVTSVRRRAEPERAHFRLFDFQHHSDNTFFVVRIRSPHAMRHHHAKEQAHQTE